MSKYFSAATGGFYDTGFHASLFICDEHVTTDPETGETLDRWCEYRPDPDGQIADAVEISDEQHAALLAGQSNGKRIVAGANGVPVLADPPAPTPEQIKAALSDAVQGHMDAAAQAAGYDDIKSAVTYADEPSVSQFQTEGQQFRAWRSLCWAACYEVMAAVAAGERDVPTADELIAELPALELPS